ncbi:MAG: hypothetical protein ABL867_04835 [Rickettsiales bacterium]
MTYSPEQHLHNASNRLVVALERLEMNLQQVTVERERDIKQHHSLMNCQRRNEELLAEQERLKATISELQEQYSELQGVATTIYGKLDTSIDRLTHILEK